MPAVAANELGSAEVYGEAPQHSTSSFGRKRALAEVADGVGLGCVRGLPVLGHLTVCLVCGVTVSTGLVCGVTVSTGKSPFGTSRERTRVVLVLCRNDDDVALSKLFPEGKLLYI